MAEAEKAKQSGDRRRRRQRIAGSILNVDFNGGRGVLLGAAAVAFLAAAFAAYRSRAHNRRRGSKTEKIQENSGEHLASHEAMEFVGSEGKDEEEDKKKAYIEERSEMEEIEEKRTPPNLYSEQLELLEINSGKNPETVIMEDDYRIDENGSCKDAMPMRLDVLCFEQHKEGDGNSFNDKVVEGLRGLCEQAVALPLESSVTAVSELEKSSYKDSVLVMEAEDVHLIAHINGIIHIEEEAERVEESNYPSTGEEVEVLMDKLQQATYPPIGLPIEEEAWPTKSCTRDNPAMIMVAEEAQLEDNATYDLNDLIQEEKVEDDMFKECKENMESSETKENLRENEECPSTKSKFSMEESLLFQFQGIDKTISEEKACSKDKFTLSIESHVRVVEPIQDNNFKISEKPLEIEEFHLGSGTVELETSLEPDKYIRADRLEMTTEYPKIIGVDEIHKEQEEQMAKLSFDVVEEGVKTTDKAMKLETMVQLIDGVKRYQSQVEAHDMNVSRKEKQQTTSVKKEKGTENMFIGYPKGHFFLLTLLATAFVVLAFIYREGFYL